ncbi:hypothetical protein ACFTWS_39295 [Streptomyces sp. NPDC057027]|uniref:hypothetical protein n=1 Tax=Streptomyces sp. NPDC057027 TaxID=3346004 RepID=UPI00362EB8E6
MLEQALTTLAAAGGVAVVQAAGTEVWTGLRQAVARWFGRGDSDRERAELERLDQTAEALTTADANAVESLRIRQEGAWQARIEALLERLDDTERLQAVEDLRALLSQHTAHGEVSTGGRGLAIGGNATIRAEGGSIAAGVINGGAHIGNPPMPDPSQG